MTPSTSPSPPLNPTSDPEKLPVQTTSSEKSVDNAHLLIDEGGLHGAHMLDAAQLADPNLKTTPDGRTILIPQPSSDPHDPLNWSYVKKHVILVIISVVSFVPDFGSSMGVITLLPQSKCVFPLHSHFSHPLYLRLWLWDIGALNNDHQGSP